MTYSEDEVNCNGATALIVSQRYCNVPVGVLRAHPFYLEWGASIYAKVSATNIIGTSEESAVGNGAIMLTVPDAPVSLSNVPDITTGS